MPTWDLFRLTRLRWHRRLPRLLLHESFQKPIKWTIRAVTAVGVLACLLTLPIPYALILSVALVALTALLENSVFFYTSLFVQPMPHFRYDPSKWKAMFYLSIGKPSPTSRKIVGLVFSDDDYARCFFELLRAWNYDSAVDTDDNIRLSFITDEDAYYVYLYPNPMRSSVTAAFGQVKEDHLLDKYGKEHQGIIMQLVLCHEFATSSGYALRILTEYHEQGRPFKLAAYLYREGQDPLPIDSVEPIEKRHFKAKIALDLNEKDFEYGHWTKLVKR